MSMLTIAEALLVIAQADVKPTDPIIDITDVLYDWACDYGRDDDFAAEWSMGMAADIAARHG